MVVENLDEQGAIIELPIQPPVGQIPPKQLNHEQKPENLA